MRSAVDAQAEQTRPGRRRIAAGTATDQIEAALLAAHLWSERIGRAHAD